MPCCSTNAHPLALPITHVSCVSRLSIDVGGKGEGERNPWVNNMNNQNQVGNGGMLASALALAEIHPDFARLVVRGAVRSLPLSQGEYYPEGAYPEGPGYWGFGTGIITYPNSTLPQR